MRKATIASGAALALLLGMPHPWVPPSAPGRVYLPHAAQRLHVPPQQPARPVLRPATSGPLIDALTVPGALVLPEPGRYWLPVQIGVAAGVTLNGRGAVTITGHGLMIRDADGVELHGLRITRVKADGVTVKRSRGVRVEGSYISRAADGLLDMNGGSEVTVVDTVFHDNIRGVLVGNWAAPKDGRERLTLINVRFENVNVRTPKLQDADLIAVNLTVIGAADHYPLDARGSSTAIVHGYHWSGGKTYWPGWRAEPGATVEVIE